jgi:hypothetical protein
MVHHNKENSDLVRDTIKYYDDMANVEKNPVLKRHYQKQAEHMRMHYIQSRNR